MTYFVSDVEFVGGPLLTVGLLSSLACVALPDQRGVKRVERSPPPRHAPCFVSQAHCARNASSARSNSSGRSTCGMWPAPETMTSFESRIS
jgi:hypothetical protein